MKRYLNSYYISNGLLIVLYFVIRQTVDRPSDLLVADDSLPSWMASSREVQVLSTGTIVIFTKYIRSPTWEAFFMNFFFFYKSCFAIILYFSNVWAMTWYVILCLICWMFFKMPFMTYDNKFLEFRSVSEFEEKVLTCPDNWVVLFYSPESVQCITTNSLWCELSLKYSNNRIKFGRVNVDIGIYIAKKCKVEDDNQSKDIPCLVVFSKGKEVKRFPPIEGLGGYSAVNYKVKDIVTYLGIDRLFLSTRDAK